jgi:hypothetical protein
MFWLKRTYTLLALVVAALQLNQERLISNWTVSKFSFDPLLHVQLRVVSTTLRTGLDLAAVWFPLRHDFLQSLHILQVSDLDAG